MSGPVLLQVCNAGRVTGGTGACAWTITRSLPGWRHLVVFPGGIADEARRTFSPVPVTTQYRIDARFVRECGASVVLLHNTVPSRVVGKLPAVTMQYVHSPGSRAKGDLTVYCSEYLARLCDGDAAPGLCATGSASGSGVTFPRHWQSQWHTAADQVLYQQVLYQPVPAPPWPVERDDARRSRLGSELLVGRLCTPTNAKWPESLVERYAEWSRHAPEVTWEFVGCPSRMQEGLLEACGGRARFVEAGWEARSRLRVWDVLLYHHPEITETFGRVVAEAMRAGCVPVVDARGGFVEQVTPETGFLCGRPEEFSAALERLRDPHVRWRMSAAGRTRGEAEFGEASFARRFHERVRQAARRVSGEVAAG
jgi:hypothetical protein